ncbi:hypothetical protein [Leifsonia sp. Root227]|uniref:hypothetical protein n=1 Tax=Leifsonia sp. Root227 TaxID=1736496 RepID=UPI000A949981|nr:hypothetical protein [Leifsonia sp. Root227]
MRVHTAWLRGVIESLPGGIKDGRSQVFVSRAVYPEQPDEKLSYPYWVIHPADGKDTSDRVTGPVVTRHPRFTVHSVGRDADQAGIAAENLRNALIVNGRGIVPSIAGEHPKPVWYSSPIPVQVDSNIQPPTCYHVAECGFDSQVL